MGCVGACRRGVGACGEEGEEPCEDAAGGVLGSWDGRVCDGREG